MAAPSSAATRSRVWDRDSEEAHKTLEAYGNTREKIVLQRLMVIGRLAQHPADRTKVGAHYEKLHFQLSKQYIRDHMTGLLLIYPSCLLHIVESSREVLVSVLKDMQQQPGCTLVNAPKIVFLENDPEGRLFQHWSSKELQVHQLGEKGQEPEEESTENLVCSVLSAVQKLGEQLDITKAVPESLLDESPDLVISEEIVENLLTRDELPTIPEHLQMYDSPVNISMDSGQVIRSSSLTTV